MKIQIFSIFHILLALIMAPLLTGIINRIKAYIAGRTGTPVLQGYYDFLKYMHKGVVYSHTTSWIFRTGSIINLSAIVLSLVLIPFAGTQALVAFDGDWILLVYLLGLGRFFVVLSALDTGSSFEGMGASREVAFSLLVEPALFVGLFALSRLSQSLSLKEILYNNGVTDWSLGAPALVACMLFIVYLCENSRIPFDDPATHLELTMIHEVMVLDHSGPDLGIIHYSSSLKLWVYGALFVGVFSPNLTETNFLLREGFAISGILFLSIIVGIVESSMARAQLIKVPQLLIGAGVLSMLAVLLVLS